MPNDEQALEGARLDDALPSILDGLSPIQVRALEELLQGRSYSQTATTLEVTRSTIYVWRHQPEFDKALRWLTAWSVGQVSRRLYTLHTRMLDEIESILDEKDQKVGVKIQALGILQRACSNAAKVSLAADLQDIKDGMADVQAAAKRLASLDPGEVESYINRLLQQDND